MSEETTKKCPHCGGEVAIGAIKCKHCWADIVDEPKTKKCPYCGEEIMSVAKKCKHCGEWLEEKTPNDTNNPVLYYVIGIVAIILIAVITSIMFIFNKPVGTTSSYGAIKPYISNSNDSSEIEQKANEISRNYSAIEILELINTQSNELLKYFKEGHSKQENTKLFKIYHSNLDVLANAFYTQFGLEDKTLNGGLAFFEENRNQILSEGDIRIKSVYDNKYGYFSIINPNTDELKIIYAGEGYLGITINYVYLYDKYAEYLEDDWKDYLRIKKSEQVENGFIYRNLDGSLSYTRENIAKLAIRWEQFVIKYPKSKLKENAENEFISFSSDIVYTSYMNMNDVRSACEYFLNNAQNKNSDAYKHIKTCYDYLAENDFKDNVNFYDIWKESYRKNIIKN